MRSKTKLYILPVLAAALVAFAVMGMVTFNAQPNMANAEGENYVYFVAPDYWMTASKTPNLYCWGGDKNPQWPGYAMDNVSGNVYRADVGTSTGMIFNANDAGQSKDITDIVGGKYYYFSGYTGGKWDVAYVDSYEATDVYFYNKDGWEAVSVYAWLGSQVKSFGDWPGKALTPISEGSKWYKATVNSGDTIIFNNNDNGAQTANLTVGANHYYYNGTWYATQDDVDGILMRAEMKAANDWYIIGKINGVENWNWSTLKTQGYTGTNKAEWYNVTLKAGDKIKAVHGNDADRAEGWVYQNTAATLGVNSIDEDLNCYILYDGTYNVYLNENYTVYIERVTTEDLGFTTVMHRTSQDKKYLLLVTGFDYSKLGEGTYTLGYFVDGELAYEENVYYEAIRMKGASGNMRFTAADLCGEGNYKLIVYEVSDGGASLKGEHEVRAFIKKDGVIVDMSTIAKGTINE